MQNANFFRLCLIIAIVGVSSACQTPSSTGLESAKKQFTSEDANSLVGKQLQLDENFLVLSADGTLSGTWGDGPLVGMWERRDGLWCRTYTEFYLPDFVDVEECHLWERNGNDVYAIRDSGKGKAYRLKIAE